MPGKSGHQALRELTGRARLDRRAQVVQGHRQAERGCDLEVGCVGRVAAKNAAFDPVVDAVEPSREGGEVSLDRVVRYVVDPDLGGDDRRGGCDGHAVGDTDLRAVEVRAERLAVALDRVPEDAPDAVLEDLVAPPLGVLDLDALSGVRGEERRVGLDLVERL